MPVPVGDSNNACFLYISTPCTLSNKKNDYFLQRADHLLHVLNLTSLITKSLKQIEAYLDIISFIGEVDSNTIDTVLRHCLVNVLRMSEMNICLVLTLIMFRSVSKVGLLRYPFGASFVTWTIPLRQETSGLVTSKTSGSGFLSAFGIGGHEGTPMTEPFPGTVNPLPIPPPKQPPKTELTTLSNGFKVASEDTWVRFRSDHQSVRS